MRNPHAESAGASDQLARRSQGSTRQTPDTQPPLDAIDVFAPGADDDEKALRRRLARAQATGSARAVRSRSDNARCLWWQVAQVASAWTFARASKDDLADILRAASMMFCAANVFERIEGGAQ